MDPQTGRGLAALYKRQGAFLNKFYRRVVPRVHRKRHALRNRRPIVTFTFDDFPSSAIRIGGEILARYAIPATYYVSMGLMRHEHNADGIFEADDLRLVVAQGHELACHTFSHYDCALTSPRSVAADLDRNAAALEEVLPGYRMTNFAYPYGNVDLATKDLAADRFATARGIWTGINAGTADLALLTAHRIYGEPENYDQAIALIRAAERVNGWLIFFTHDVQPDPSPYGSRPEDLERVVRAAAESRCERLTMRDAVAAIGWDAVSNAPAG